MSLADIPKQSLQAPSRDELIPPPRFDNATFESYLVDENIDGQRTAVETVQAFAQRPRKRWFHWKRRTEKPGLYLDGDFGVGKTHLLAAMFHACTGSKTYCSFAEAINLAVIHGPAEAVNILSADLVCIDEFELDDPSNTRLADLLVEGLISNRSRIAVTSNTVPGELGEGRMAVDKFRSQLVRIANVFEDVHVPGHDYRQRSRLHEHQNPKNWGPEVSGFDQANTSIDMHDFDKILVDIPIINLRRLAINVPQLHLCNVQPCADQLIALRLVHAIDKLYDYHCQLRVQSDINLEDLFLPEYRDWAFAKKYRRCSSRLAELCAEDT